MQKKILIVEDDSVIGEALELELKEDGFSVMIATDGEEGVLAVGSYEPDLILLDVLLPKKDGFTVLRELKKNEQTKEIPVFLLTNLGSEQDYKLGVELGAVEYLVKVSTDLEDLSKKIAEYIIK